MLHQLDYNGFKHFHLEEKLSFGLKYDLSSTSNPFDAIILDGRNSNGTGYLMVYYKGGKNVYQY